MPAPTTAEIDHATQVLFLRIGQYLGDGLDELPPETPEAIFEHMADDEPEAFVYGVMNALALHLIIACRMHKRPETSTDEAIAAVLDLVQENYADTVEHALASWEELSKLEVN